MSGRTLAVALIAIAASLPAFAAPPCVSITDAAKHIGATKCVIGKVIRVKQGNRGVHFFDFCEDYRTCPFTVVVFSGDLERIGDVRQLVGRQIEIDAEIRSYDGRAEIVLRRLGQLRGDAARIPALPKDYDVERHGNTAQERSATRSNRKARPAKSSRRP